MPFSLLLPPPWAGRGWKVKIRDRERLEPPHVTILHRTRLERAWNAMYPENPVLSEENDE